MAKITKQADRNNKEIRITKGKNIRFTDKSHKLLSNFCKKHGYNLGAFCESGALKKMELLQNSL